MIGTVGYIERAAAIGLVGILTLGAVPLTQVHAETAPQWQTPESVRSAVHDFVVSLVGDDVSVEIAGIDERLRLPACGVQLATAAQSAFRNGQGTVAVSCKGAQAWRLFVPVRTVSSIGVLVTTRAVAAGERLSSADYMVEARPSTGLPYQYFTAHDQADGLIVRRSLPAGTVLVPAAVDTPKLIERGALVTLISGNGSIVVRAEGIALEAGAVNQRVRVRSPSGRVVEGVVASSGEVRIGL